MPDKRVVGQVIRNNTVGALGISAADVFLALVPVPKENFSFGRGEVQLAKVSQQRPNLPHHRFSIRSDHHH
ncbi:hypothetical protein [Aeromicrobium sp. HA]|uniref:hypothetical protein n=1 Tax=Aeromicrobium sp. HA TaxID=3009077 RepID=UPI0022AFBC93|nr:hypothetical protein [Aeromicrobium sp. HA]